MEKKTLGRVDGFGERDREYKVSQNNSQGVASIQSKFKRTKSNWYFLNQHSIVIKSKKTHDTLKYINVVV